MIVIDIDFTTKQISATTTNDLSIGAGGGGGGSFSCSDLNACTTIQQLVADKHTHTNKSILDEITEAFTTGLKSAYDGAVSWITTNGTNLINHLSNTSNPHNTTASQVGAYTPLEVDTALNLKSNNAVQRTGTSIAFDNEANYGTIATPETGNITGDYTNARIGVVQLIIHNHSVAPAIPATWVMLTGSQAYKINQLNRIYVEWSSSNIANYTILQAI